MGGLHTLVKLVNGTYQPLVSILPGNNSQSTGTVGLQPAEREGTATPDLCKALTHLRQYLFTAMTGIRKVFYNLKVDLKAVALRKIWTRITTSLSVRKPQT